MTINRGQNHDLEGTAAQAAQRPAGWRSPAPGLGREGPPSKISEGYFRFLCPCCGEMRRTVNPRNNLAHCFYCQKNFNNIDLLITLDYDFRAAVALLERWLKQYQARQARKEASVLRFVASQLPLPVEFRNGPCSSGERHGPLFPLGNRSLCHARPLSRTTSAWQVSQPRRAGVLQNPQQFGKVARSPEFIHV